MDEGMGFAEDRAKTPAKYSEYRAGEAIILIAARPGIDGCAKPDTNPGSNGCGYSG